MWIIVASVMQILPIIMSPAVWIVLELGMGQPRLIFAECVTIPPTMTIQPVSRIVRAYGMVLQA